MPRLASRLAALVLCVTFGAPAWGGELTREISLIQRLGKAEMDRRHRATEPPTPVEIQAAARNIDQYIQVLHAEKKVQPAPPANDDVFLRRIYLDIAGRIPTIQETVEFARDRSANKRAQLIDKLLESEGYVHHNYTWWADLLRVQTVGGVSSYGGIAYANWIKQALRENKTYDRIVYDLITADGFPWENGAAGFYIRDDGMPLDHMATTVQVFLGTSLQCAQCHDHPFDKWSQYEFYEMAAFTSGVQTRRQSPNIRKAMEMADSELVREALRRMAQRVDYGVSETAASIKLPHDYQYSDASPHDPVRPHTIFGSKAQPADGQSLREAYAKWMIDRQNPRFTLTIANRMWQKVFGVGLIEPLDQLTDDSEALSPELMAFLTHKMEAWGYDLRQFQRMLFNTQLYQRQVATHDPAEGEPYYFPGPLLRRMSAEQLWDSIVTLSIPEPDYRRGELSSGDYFRQVVALTSATPEQLLSIAREQAEYDTQRRELMDKIREARDARNEALVKSLNAQREGLKPPTGLSMMAMMGDKGSGSATPNLDDPYPAPTKDPRTWEGFPEYLVRASEMDSPAGAGHFLRQFGQSDRDIMNNASAEPNIIQVLAMFNGPLFEEVISDKSQIMKNVWQAGAPLDKVRMIFLSVLSREPNSHEKSAIERLAWPTGMGPDYPKIVWALLNTREFSFIQ